VTPSATGRTTDLDAAIGGALAAVTTAEPTSASIALPALPVEPRVTNEAAQSAADEATAMTSRPLALTVGDQTFTIAPEALRSWVGFEAGADGDLALTLAEAPIVEAIEGLRAKVDTSPRNASFKTGDGRVTGVVAGANGRRLDAEASAAQVRDLLADTGPGAPAPSLALALAVVEPAVTTEEAEAVAPRMRRISSWSTHFQVSEKNFFGKNISVPTSIIDGTVVAPGDWFSFWETVGEVTEERGFGPGGAIINGRTEPTGAIAGGICSCSTTLFNAALRAGYEMGDRRNHFYYISRYPKGLDATVFKSDYTDQDMKWRNDTEYPVLIRGINATGVVTFELYSVDPGRRGVLTDPIVKNPRPAKDTIEYTSKLRPGQRERVEHPADGFDAWVTRRVYQGDKVIHRETYYSHYARVDGVVRVGR
jgi:vancomycin resistance protein YoaR